MSEHEERKEEDSMTKEIVALRAIIDLMIRNLNVVSAALHNSCNELSDALSDPVKFVERRQPNRT